MSMLAVLEPGAPASSREALALARQVAENLRPGPPVDAPAAHHSGLSVEAVGLPDDVTAEAAGASLAQLVAELEPAGVFAPASEFATEVMAHVAAQARLPLATNCIAVHVADPTSVDHGRNGLERAGRPRFAHDQHQQRGHPEGAPWGVTRVRGGGVLWEDAELAAPTKLVTVAPGYVEPIPAPDVREVRHLLEPVEESSRLRLVERAAAAAGGVTLATAPVVVSGGRGVGGAEGFAVLEELAELLGGAVGCSRVATNNGWRPHSDQVGQTGTKIAPEVYIAAGISGATQHWAGCMGSKTILAVNTDSEAPMVTRADYAVIGDAQEVLQAVVDEIRQRASPLK